MGIVQTDEEQSCIQDRTSKAGTYKADAEEDGTGRGSEGRGQGNFELATNCDYIPLGQLTQGKVSVSVGFQSFP